MLFYIKFKIEYVRGVEFNYLYSYFLVVFLVESWIIGRVEFNIVLVYICMCMYGFFFYFSMYMYIVLEMYICKVMCEVWIIYGYKIVIFIFIEKK